MCKWKSQYVSDYQCDDSPLNGDPKDYCILHSDENKDVEAFKDKVEERITKGKLTSSGQETDKIDLRGCYFPKDFDRQFFKGKEFKKAIFNEAIFLQPIDFTGVTFNDTADFTLVIFSDKADFENAIFKKGVCFLSASFAKEAVFRGTRFKEGVNFDTTCFEDKVDFTWTEFWGWTFFFRNSKRNSVNLGSLPLEIAFPHNLKEKIRYDTNRKRLIFEDAMSEKERNQLLGLSENISYQKATKELFQKCQKLTLGNPTEFRHTRFLGEATFQKVDLSRCSFLESNIDKVDFRDCEFGEEREYLLGFFPIDRQNVLYDERNAKTELDFDMAVSVYRDLEKNFNGKGDRRSAIDFYYGEMECKRKQIRWGDICSSLYNFLHVLSRQITGYGVRLERSLFFVLLLLVASCVFYKYYEGLCWGQAVTNSLFGINVLLATIYNHINELSEYGRWFFWFQIVVGTFLTAAFVLTLQRVFTPFK